MRTFNFLLAIAATLSLAACPDIGTPLSFDTAGIDTSTADTTTGDTVTGDGTGKDVTAPDVTGDTTGTDTAGADTTGTDTAGTDTTADSAHSSDTTADGTHTSDVSGHDTPAKDTTSDVIVPNPVGTNHPCEESATGGSKDAAMTDCVCANDSYCCDNAWDDVCVSVAVGSCSANCECTSATPEELACGTDADCGWCPADACTGAYTCVSGTCAATPVVCDATADTACSINTCDPTDGTCAIESSDSLCDDSDYCTVDVCDATGTCTYTAEACAQHPCEAADTAGSNDATITACVCAEDSFCCDNQWDSICVGVAQDTCGAPCDCSVADSTALACATDADCLFCGGDLCEGGYTCDTGTSLCTQLTTVVCDATGDTACNLNTCDGATGTCGMVADDSLCDDSDVCTLDVCDATSQLCTNGPNPACDNHPCLVSPVGESNDATVTACVCAEDSSCCDTQWNSTCVAIAQASCGMNCDCTTADAADLACTEDADCAWCGGDECQGWQCSSNTCVRVDHVTCDTTDDSGCNINTCNPNDGTCAMTLSDTACEDSDACTADSCDVDLADGTCNNIAVPNCTGTPAYECGGTATPAISGCDATALNEGCCDPWGRVTWCEGGNTYCIDCAGANPVCGWSADAGFYDCGEPDYTPDPAGAAPIQCPGLTYAN